MSLQDPARIAQLGLDIQAVVTAQGAGPERLGQLQPEEPQASLSHPSAANGRDAPVDVISLFDLLIDQSELRETTRDLFANKHYALAVEEAYKCINNLVKRRASQGADGAGLMTKVSSVDKPVLRLNSLKDQSQRDQQQGYMLMFAGSMTGIRNPRAHEHKYLDQPHVALELLMFANHLMRMVMSATRTRSRTK